MNECTHKKCLYSYFLQIWDYETGDYERTLKGHTDSVQDVAFDHSGKWLGKSKAARVAHLALFMLYSCV